MDCLKLKWIKDLDGEIQLTFDAYIGSNVPQDVSFVVTKEQLKKIIELVY